MGRAAAAVCAAPCAATVCILAVCKIQCAKQEFIEDIIDITYPTHGKRGKRVANFAEAAAPDYDGGTAGFQRYTMITSIVRLCLDRLTFAKSLLLPDEREMKRSFMLE